MSITNSISKLARFTYFNFQTFNSKHSISAHAHSIKLGILKFRSSEVASGGFGGPRNLVPEMLMKIWSETTQASSLELNTPSVNSFIYDLLFALYTIINISHELRNKLNINRKLIPNITIPRSPMLIHYGHSAEDKQYFFLVEHT